MFLNVFFRLFCMVRYIFQYFFNPMHKNIKISDIYFMNYSERKQLYYKEHNIKNIWKLYENDYFKPNIGDMIEVNYSVPYIKLNKSVPYKVIYTYPNDITFPPYSLEKINNYENQNTYKNGILFALSGQKDITKEIVKLAGPLCNFYSDLSFIKIPKKIVSDSDIIITTNNGDDITFTEDILNI